LPIHPPSLRSIAAFEAAARHQSFTRAAAELNLTAGAVSHAIKALETRLDRDLFVRSGRKVSLTPDGQSLAARIRLSLALLGDAFDVSPWLHRDRLVVSVLPSVAEKILLPALARLERALPDLAIELRCSAALADLDEIDVAIRFGPGGWSGVQSRHLADERLTPVASPHYRGGDLPRTPEDLRRCQLIHHPESSWRMWLDPIGISVEDLPSRLSIDDSALILQAAMAGYGVALARVRAAAGDLGAGRLVRLFDRDVAAEYSYWAVWRGSSAKGALIRGFCDWAAEAFGVAAD
jgi:LysR family glycine cleavage system transcriptional activator